MRIQPGDPSGLMAFAPSFAIALVIAASGCGGSTDQEGSSGAEPASSSEPSTTAASPSEADETATGTGSEVDARARKALRAALRALVRANTGRYQVTIPFSDDVSIHDHGRYQVVPAAYDSVREQTSPEGVTRIAYRGVGEESWFRLESLTSENDTVQSWPCWVSYDDIARVDGFPAELAQAPSGQPPAAVVAATYGVGDRYEGLGVIEGSIDLALALGLLSGKAVVASGIDPQGDSTTAATFSLDGKTLAGFTVPLADIPDAVERAGGDSSTELDYLASLPGAVTTRFTDLGSPVEIQAPPPGQQLAFTNADDFESAMRSCGR